MASIEGSLFRERVRVHILFAFAIFYEILWLYMQENAAHQHESIIIIKIQRGIGL